MAVTAYAHYRRLYGITVAQTLYYFYHNRNGRYAEKIWVRFVHDPFDRSAPYFSPGYNIMVGSEYYSMPPRRNADMRL